ncbi:MAG TPA: DUF998 domain-containing protein [Gaiella sp.]|jgi:hypothetical protein
MTAALLGFVCVAASGAILVTLHFLPTGLDPIRYAVSDYGWTSYGLGYRAMVVLQGVGAILIAVGLDRETDVRSLGWLYVYGVVRLLIAGFMTDREPESLRTLTLTGHIHMLLAGTAFASIAVAASHLDWTGKPAVLGPLGWLVTATAIATATALVVPTIRRVALGLIERSHYAAAIAWLLVVSGSIV